MRRRVRICLVILFIILLMPVLTLIAVYHSPWAKKINYDSTSSDFWVCELTYNKNKDAFSAGHFSYEVAAYEVEYVIKKLNGSVNVILYGGNVNSIDEYETIINAEHEIMRYELTEAGTHKYSVRTKCNCLALVLELTEGSEYTYINVKEYEWVTNWEHLLAQLGIRKGGKSSIDTIRTVVE